jgi:hypothetical protein
MIRRCAMATVAALLCGAPACGADDTKAGADRCASASGALSECGPTSLAGADDACWRLAQCGAIPVANAESSPDCCFDWSTCVEHVEGLPDEQFELALACIEAATCDELKARSSPGRAADLPACLEHGPL